MLKEKGAAIRREIKEHKLKFVFFVGLRILVILTMIAQFFNKNYENVFLCVITLLLTTLPGLIERTFKIDLPDTLEVMILLFIFASGILGEIQEYYLTFPFWDMILHAINGFIAAAIGFSLVDLLNRRENITFYLSPIYMAVAAFCFSMTIGVIWEFFEFLMDIYSGTDMQKDTFINTIRSVKLNPDRKNIPISIENIQSVFVNGIKLKGYLDIGLFDTMKDLFVNFFGAAVFSFFGFFYVKNRGKGKLIKKFILKRRD